MYLLKRQIEYLYIEMDINYRQIPFPPHNITKSDHSN